MEERSTLGKILSITASIAIRVIVYVAIGLILIKGVKVAYNFGHDIFYAHAVEAKPGRDIEVTIPEGSSIQDAATIMENAGLIDNKISFIVQSKFFELKAYPGTYELNTSKTSREILEILNANKPPKEEQNEN